MQDSDDVRARMTIAVLTEPGHTVTGQLLRIIGPAETLALLRDARIPLPSQVDPVLGAQWREATAARLLDGLADQAARLTDQHELRILTPGRAGWPASLADLGDRAPVMLWAKGNPELLTSSLASRVTFTGARASSAYGEHVTRELVADLLRGPRIVVAGGAYGIDAATHRAALAARSASTIAVLAGGLDRPYPAGHTELFQDIVDAGGIQISETPPATAPTKWRFIARARLLAALGGASIIPEAGYRSGSLLVAARATELGRPVGTVPGPITSAASSGCHRLLREGLAEVITHAGEITELLDPAPPSFLSPAIQEVARRAAPNAGKTVRRAAL
ncbi:DNA-processing protein DprA [Microbacterium azadirachtae]|uniref:DNA processing protein n=1 Tax=Microbacterium azadirachtae TaxID=582680 RepID=A0A1I6GAB8_9MICO|nr:DNA-processing protein DprA [Microbacterium azadirachtae]SDL38977.1 DNA processing protein [Microbacterium azadirachtae]SEF69961.1 DNA processing protein [Microbacterium azadirachtae]SEF70692.1 DNA processing protein [Microbacterium azadirachtae]SFR39080.1 DNA processing protein [Microbacterium azadirachtae]